MAHDVFISHSTNNRPVANAVCAALEREAIRCWIAPRDVMPGRPYSGEITRAIQQSRAFVLIFRSISCRVTDIKGDRRNKIAKEMLTRGVEPPRVSPYGPEPYASAIPPRER